MTAIFGHLTSLMKKSNPFLPSVQSYLQSEMFLSNSIDVMKNLQSSVVSKLYLRCSSTSHIVGNSDCMRLIANSHIFISNQVGTLCGLIGNQNKIILFYMHFKNSWFYGGKKLYFPSSTIIFSLIRKVSYLGLRLVDFLAASPVALLW